MRICSFNRESGANGFRILTFVFFFLSIWCELSMVSDFGVIPYLAPTHQRRSTDPEQIQRRWYFIMDPYKVSKPLLQWGKKVCTSSSLSP